MKTFFLRYVIPAAWCLLFAFAAAPLYGQTTMGGTTPNASAELDVQSTSRGMLPPRLTTAQRNAIVNPATGLLIFNTTLNCVEMNIGTPTSPAWGCFNTTNTVTAASATPTVCRNAVITPITHATTGATGIGTATGLPSGLTATWASNTITISGTPTAAGTFNYSIPLTGGLGSAQATGTITVAFNTVSAATSIPVLPINTALTPITLTTTGATGIGTPTGLPAGVTASWASNTITISGTPTVSGTFMYSIPLTGGCGTVNATGTITVTANNTVGAPSSIIPLCTNTPMASVTYMTTGATGIGTATGLPVGVTASWGSNRITMIGTPTSPGVFNYSIPLTGGCGTVFATGSVTVVNFVPNPDINATFVGVPLNSGSVRTNDVVPVGTIYGPAVPVGAHAGGAVLNLEGNGEYTFMSISAGLFAYEVPVMSPQGCMQEVTLEISVLGLAEAQSEQPNANTDISATQQNKKVVVKALANDLSEGSGVALVPNSVAIVVPPAASAGTAVAMNNGTGDIEFTPHPDFTGLVSFSYRVCDDRTPALCDTANVRITVIPLGAPNTTVASDDYNRTIAGELVSGSVLINDNDPEEHSLTVQPLDTSVQGVGRLDLRNNPYPSNKLYDPRATARMGIAANGTYTFYPVPGFSGPVQFVYRVCDNGMPQACTEATLYILVTPADARKTDCGCTQNITVSLDTACQFVLHPWTVSPLCGSATVRVMDTNPLNGDTIDCPGVWTYGLFNSAGTLICWGKVTAEDKRGPALTGIRGRCNVGTKVNVPNPRPAFTPFQVDSVSQVWKDTFLCLSVDKVYNSSDSWQNTG